MFECLGTGHGGRVRFLQPSRQGPRPAAGGRDRGHGVVGLVGSGDRPGAGVRWPDRCRTDAGSRGARRVDAGIRRIALGTRRSTRGGRTRRPRARALRRRATGLMLMYLGQAAEALEWIERAREIDPFFDPPWYFRAVGQALMNLHRYDEALAMFEQVTPRSFRIAALQAGC